MPLKRLDTLVTGYRARKRRDWRLFTVEIWAFDVRYRPMETKLSDGRSDPEGRIQI
jgi:hypothetical protein